MSTQARAKFCKPELAYAVTDAVFKAATARPMRQHAIRLRLPHAAARSLVTPLIPLDGCNQANLIAPICAIFMFLYYKNKNAAYATTFVYSSYFQNKFKYIYCVRDHLTLVQLPWNGATRTGFKFSAPLRRGEPVATKPFLPWLNSAEFSRMANFKVVRLC